MSFEYSLGVPRLRTTLKRALTLALVVLGGCGPVTRAVGSGPDAAFSDAGSNACGGCRDTAGGCHRGDTPDACGNGGYACQVCAVGTACSELLGHAFGLIHGSMRTGAELAACKDNTLMDLWWEYDVGPTLCEPDRQELADSGFFAVPH